MRDETLEERTIWTERCELAVERTSQICGEEKVPMWADLFSETAEHLIRLYHLTKAVQDGSFFGNDPKEKEMLSRTLWAYHPEEKAEPERFQKWADLLAFEWQGLISEAYRGRWIPFVLYTELFLQVYGAVQELADSPDALAHELRDILYWFYSDNSEIFCMEAAEMLFASDSEKERVLRISRNNPQYLYESGSRINAAARKRAQAFAFCSEEALENAAAGLLQRAGELSSDCVYLGFEPGMEPLAASCVRRLEEEGKKVCLFPEQSFLPLRSPEFLHTGSVRMRSGVSDRRNEEYLILDPRYRERKIEVWNEACKRFPYSKKPAVSLVLRSEPGEERIQEQPVGRSAKRLAQEMDEAVSRLLGKRILLEEQVVVIQKVPFTVGKEIIL